MDVLPHFGQDMRAPDCILAKFRLQTVEVWNDFALPIGSYTVSMF